MDPQENAASASASGSASKPSQSSAVSRIEDFFFRRPENVQVVATDSAAEAAKICPPVDVRLGASTLTVPPNNTDAFSLRYQGTIGNMARECNVTGGIMRMKVGIQGRVLVGPAGGPGKIEVPLRYAVVKEGPEPKTVISKLYKVPVVIGEGQPNVAFTHVDNDVSFPMPPGLDIDAYVVYVGFDPLAEKQPPAKKPASKPAVARQR